MDRVRTEESALATDHGLNNGINDLYLASTHVLKLPSARS